MTLYTIDINLLGSVCASWLVGSCLVGGGVVGCRGKTQSCSCHDSAVPTGLLSG
jgi:hypothetical protein